MNDYKHKLEVVSMLVALIAIDCGLSSFIKYLIVRQGPFIIIFDLMAGRAKIPKIPPRDLPRFYRDRTCPVDISPQMKGVGAPMWFMAIGAGEDVVMSFGIGRFDLSI